MKIIKNFKILVLGLISLSALNACTDNFEEINQNPNGPEEVPPVLLLPAIQEQTADLMLSTFHGGDMGEAWVQHWGKVQYNEEERYNVRPGSINNVWNLLYARPLTDTEIMYRSARENENQALMGISLVWRSYVYSMLTDLYGDIPYTQALQATDGIISPEYDRQENIYPALIDSLQKADQYLANGGSIDGSRDLVYGGDVTNWRKFANSLRFRLIMRGSGTGAGGQKLSQSYLDQLQQIVNSGMHFTSNADNAELNYLGENPNANPVWNTVVFSTRSEWKVNQTLVQKLEELSDPRLEVYAQPNADGDYRGVAPGILNPTTNGFDVANTSAIGAYFLQPTTPAVFMSNAQLKLLMAEAAARGLISGGHGAAEEFYNEGIAASFQTYHGQSFDGVTHSLDVDSYLANVAYNSSTALQQIGEQEWIALYGQGFEAWTEYRRTGYPMLSPAIDPLGITEIPSRYPYPTDEQTLNSANYKAAASAMGSDKMTTPVWWMAR